MASRRLRAAPRSAMAALVSSSALVMCQAPTEITVAITTDVPCAQMQGATVTVGARADVETKAPSTSTVSCTDAGDLGTITVVPSGTADAEVVIKIVGGVGRDPSTCVAPGYGIGCIVARRDLDFVPRTPLRLDVPLRGACNGVVCPPDQTCVSGSCTSSSVGNEGACKQNGAGCGEGSLQPSNGQPLAPSPLVCGDTGGLEPSAPWPMLGMCPTHAARSPYVGAQSATVRWKTTAGGALLAGVAIAADGSVYVGGQDKALHAVDGATGALKWSARAGATFTNVVPLVVKDGSIWVGADDGRLYHVDATGHVLGSTAIGTQLYTSANVAPDGTLLVGGGPKTDDTFGLNGEGSVQWMAATVGSVESSPSIGLDGTVYFGAQDDDLYAVTEQGKPDWKFGAQDAVHTTVVGTNGWIYFNGKPAICAVDGTGKLRWITATTGNAGIPALGADGTVYAGTTAGQFYAIQGGTVLWNATLGAFDTNDQAVIGADGTIYVGSTSGDFYALTPAGQTKWTLHTGGAIRGPAAIGADGTVYVPSGDGNLYAVGP